MSFLDSRSLSRAVCVSKHWAEVGLDILWRQVYDLRRLLRILAPIVKMKGRRRDMPPGRHVFYVSEMIERFQWSVVCGIVYNPDVV